MCKVTLYHFCADDIQLYVSDDETICLTALKVCMDNNFLQLNAAKTEILITASDTIALKVAQCIVALPSAVQSNLRNLGVIFDQGMHFDQHIMSLIRA